MQLWKIVDELEYDVLQSTGRLITDESFIDQNFRSAYRWMVKQMGKRLGPPPIGIAYPQWAWLHWNGADKKRPDLRVERHRVPSGKHYLLELEMTEDSILVSDFERWHFVLNGWYLPRVNEDEELRGFKTRRERNAEIERSWEAIVDIPGQVDPELWGRPEEWALQATFWELRLGSVKSQRAFKSAK